MPNPQFTKPWHGVPREAIGWNPTVDPDACIGCGTCVTGCSRLVYRFDFEHQKAVVIDPLNCMVGCTTCANTCPTNAISFPPIETVFALERRAEVHHAIEDDLLARREQLAWRDVVPHPQRRVHLVVEAITDAGPRTRLVTLVPTGDTDGLCQFSPGQYLQVEVPGSDMLARAYSIANAPCDDGRVELQVRQVPDGRFSTWVFETMRPGDVVDARGPVGGFTFRSPVDVPLVFVAGGTGFAPIKALIEAQLALTPQRRIFLVWGNGNADDFYGLDELATWCRADPNMHVVVAVEQPEPHLDVPAGITMVTGRIDDAIATLGALAGADAYVAGPPVMMPAVIRALTQAGVAHDRVLVDSFGELTE
jgi:CDP-4-dehydro-6-deoxyglucose reductase